jgi:putative transposase
MPSLDDLINESPDSREVKRALSVKMGLSGIAPATISQILNVSVQYVSKWKTVYKTEGAGGLAVGYHGRQGYLSASEQAAVIAWINAQETVSVEALRDYVEDTYGVVYQSKQSYYDLLEAGGMSYHHSEKVNPKRDEAQVQMRREEIKKRWHRTGTPSSGATR